jgi:uroporphyrinogen decarboxylase
MGIRFQFTAGEGPSIDEPLRSEADLARARRFEPREDLAVVLDAIRQIKVELAGRVPLIGFAGAPFTLASYAIEGGHSSAFAHTKALMYGAPQAWHRFCDLLADLIGDYLAAQIDAGVDAVQLFDSWVGALNAADYREFVLPHTRRIFERVAECRSAEGRRVPAIHFGVGTGSILGDLRDAGGDVIGADWRTPLDEAWSRIGPDRGIQGNLDPTVLLGPLDRIFAATDDVLAQAGGRAGHVFNLGHGILPMTPVEHVQALARYVHQKTCQ